MGFWAAAEIFKEQTERLTLFSQYRRFIYLYHHTVYQLKNLKVWEATTFPSVSLKAPVHLELELVLYVFIRSCNTSVACWIRCFYFVISERKSYLTGLSVTLFGRGMLPGCIYATGEGMKISDFVLLRHSCFTAEHNGGYRLAAKTVVSTLTIVLFFLWTTVLLRWHIAPMKIVCDGLLRTL